MQTAVLRTDIFFSQLLLFSQMGKKLLNGGRKKKHPDCIECGDLRDPVIRCQIRRVFICTLQSVFENVQSKNDFTFYYTKSKTIIRY